MFAACFGRTATHDFREGPLLSSERHSVDATLGTASRDVKPGCVFCDVRTEKGFRVVAEVLYVPHLACRGEIDMYTPERGADSLSRPVRLTEPDTIRRAGSLRRPSLAEVRRRTIIT